MSFSVPLAIQHYIFKNHTVTPPSQKKTDEYLILPHFALDISNHRIKYLHSTRLFRNDRDHSKCETESWSLKELRHNLDQWI